MRRHQVLIPLSRFHRSVLFTAQMAKRNGPKFKGYPTEPKEKAQYAYDFYVNALKAHFQLEEEQLLPNIKGIDQALDLLIEEIIQEHQQLHVLFNQLPESVDLENLLDKIGFQLEAHIRKEERQLFQTIQKVCSQEQLQQLGISLGTLGE